MVVITGRENVGKSTLLNRMVGKNVAVVGRTPGITRDFIDKCIEKDGRQLEVVDTGGVYPTKVGIKTKVQEKLYEILNRASLILFMVDVKDGITEFDKEIAANLRKLGRPVWIIVNKVDRKDRLYAAQNFLVLGFKDIYPVSALKGYGVREIVDDIFKELSIKKKTIRRLPVISIMGRPNVGKSTYVNSLIGKGRMIVDESPGTTVDVCDVHIKFEGREIVLADTPGLKRRGKIKTDVEKGSTALTISNTKRIDVGIVLIESNYDITREDKKIVQLLVGRGKGVVIAANKSDLGKYFLGHNLHFASHIPIVYMSALTKKNIYQPLREAIRVYDERKKMVSNDELDRLRSIMTHVRLYSLVQVSTAPPRFKVKGRKKLTEGNLRYIERCIRERLGFRGVPINFEL